MTPALNSLTLSTFLFFSLVVLAYAIHRLLLVPRFLSPLRNIPGPPLGDPIFGIVPAILGSTPGEVQSQWVKGHGPVVRAVGPAGIERLIFVKPNALRQILVSEWSNCPRPDFMKNCLGVVLGYGLLTVTGAEHKQMRKVMNPAFSIQHLTAQTEMYYEPIETLVQILKSQLKNKAGGTIIRMQEWMSKVTLDIICDTAFGYKTNSLHNPDNELAQAYEGITTLQSIGFASRMALLMLIPGGPTFLRSELAYRYRHLLAKSSFFYPFSVLIDSMHRIKAVSAQMLASKVSESSDLAAEDGPRRKDIMSLLVRARSTVKDGVYRMSDEDMMSQVLTFLAAGHDTTAAGLAWTLWSLATSPSAQSRLRDEVTPAITANSRPDYRSLNDLQYLDCVVMESLRLFPPIPITFRKAGRDTYIDGIFVPKGTLFYIPISVVNTYHEVWGPDAEEFRPERWLSLPESYDPVFSSLTFFAGPHACIGKTMAIIEMKAVLVHLITNFEFRPAYEGQEAQRTAAFTMKPKDDMPLLVVPIHPA